MAPLLTDPALDYTLVAVRPRGTGQTEIKSFGFNRLIEQQGKILIGEALNIIQHPNGELKQVALRENQLKDILPKFLHYHTDTAPGSSGSPFVDLHPDRKLRSIYSHKPFDPEELIREDFRIEQERAARLRERMATEGTLTDERLAEAMDLLEAQLPFNCEHVVPQSWFEKKEPMRATCTICLPASLGATASAGTSPILISRTSKRRFATNAGSGTPIGSSRQRRRGSSRERPSISYSVIPEYQQVLRCEAAGDSSELAQYAPSH